MRICCIVLITACSTFRKSFCKCCSLTENDTEHLFLSWGETFSLEKHPQVSIFTQVRSITMLMIAGQVTGMFCIVNVGNWSESHHVLRNAGPWQRKARDICHYWYLMMATKATSSLWFCGTEMFGQLLGISVQCRLFEFSDLEMRDNFSKNRL